MIGLRELRHLGVRTWADAASTPVPHVDQYRIAWDCLRGAPDRPAIVEIIGDSCTTITYGDLNRLSGRFANHLVSQGVVPGDRVAVKLGQGVDMAVTVIGALRAGAVVVPISNVLASGSVTHRLDDAEPRVLVCAGADEELELVAGRDVDVITTSARTGMRLLEETVSRGRADVTARTDGAASEPALLLYTSGTSGKPKGVLQAQSFLLGHHAIEFAFNRIHADDVAYSPVDWTWAGGLMLGLLVPLAHGITVVAHRERGFDPEHVLSWMAKTNVTIGLFPPTVLRMFRASGLLEGDNGADLSLRCAITGAEAVEPDLLDWADSCGLTVNNAYGQTEANAVVGHSGYLGALDVRSMGRPYPGHRVAVLDDALELVDAGVPGQLCIASGDPVCMLGYWNNAEATDAKIRGDWLLTGDTVHRDEAGQLYFHGRSDDIIKSGAYRLGPAEIEAALLRAPEVARCAAIGTPDPIRGELVTAVLELEPSAQPTDDLEQRCRQLVRDVVGAHAYPRAIHYLEHLPTTTTGKVDRAGVRRLLAEKERTSS